MNKTRYKYGSEEALWINDLDYKDYLMVDECMTSIIISIEFYEALKESKEMLSTYKRLMNLKKK